LIDYCTCVRGSAKFGTTEHPEREKMLAYEIKMLCVCVCVCVCECVCARALFLAILHLNKPTESHATCFEYFAI